MIPDLHDLHSAARRIEPYVHHTPVMTSHRIDAMIGAELLFKCENLQRTGSFKIRGATNTVRLLSDEEAGRGVATHSSGNHGAALCAAARSRGIPAYIVVPEGAVASKVKAIQGYGGDVIRCAPTQAAREETLEAVLEGTGATMVHPYNDPRIIAGQGTAGLELMEQTGGVDVLVCPVGGGGLISGCALAAKLLRPDTLVIGAEPAGADDTARSLAVGEIVEDVVPDTIADGLRARVGKLTFQVIQRHVAEVVTVTDPEIVEAMKIIWHTMKLVIEPSSATVFATVLKIRNRLAGKRIGLVLSGGNVDLDHLPWYR